MPSAAAWVPMCQPSASSAIEPKNEPAAISPTIIDERQRDHEPGAALVLRVLFAEKDVVVHAVVDGMGVHRTVSDFGDFRWRYNHFVTEYYHMTARCRRRSGEPAIDRPLEFRCNCA